MLSQSAHITHALYMYMYIPSHSIHEVVVDEEDWSERSGYPEVVLLPYQYGDDLNVHHSQYYHLYTCTHM